MIRSAGVSFPRGETKVPLRAAAVTFLAREKSPKADIRAAALMYPAGCGPFAGTSVDRRRGNATVSAIQPLGRFVRGPLELPTFQIMRLGRRVAGVLSSSIRQNGAPAEAQRSGFGGERRRKGAGAVFAEGGNGAKRTLRRRERPSGPMAETVLLPQRRSIGVPAKGPRPQDT